MLDKELKKKIIKKSWKTFLKDQSNLSQTRIRIKTQCKSAIEDLILLSKKLPDDELKQIFGEDDLKSLISAILSTDSKDFGFVKSLSHLDSYRIQLCEALMKECLYFYKSQIRLLFNNMPFHAQNIINQLENSQNLCDEISYKIQLDKHKETEDQENLTYLFNWSKVPGTHEKRLEFLTQLNSVMNFLSSHNVTNISKSKDNSTINCFLESDITDDPVKVDMKINENNPRLRYLFANKETLEIPLVVKFDGKLKQIYIKNKYF